MVAKKRAKVLSSSSSSGSLFGEEALAPTEPAPPIPAAGGVMPIADDVPVLPRIRLVPPRPDEPEEDVIIEPTDDGRYAVSLLRHHGSTVATVVYTRAQLGMLVRRIPAALEVG